MKEILKLLSHKMQKIIVVSLEAVVQTLPFSPTYSEARNITIEDSANRVKILLNDN